ncbi:hypothetical protein EC988_002489, partial [Linderina pennispora]
ADSGSELSSLDSWSTGSAMGDITLSSGSEDDEKSKVKMEKGGTKGNTQPLLQAKESEPVPPNNPKDTEGPTATKLVSDQDQPKGADGPRELKLVPAAAPPAESSAPVQLSQIRQIPTDDEDEEQTIPPSHTSTDCEDDDNHDDDETAIHEDDSKPDDSHLSLGWTSLASIVPNPLFDPPSAAASKLGIMKERAEWDLCSRLDASKVPLNMSARRLRRRLHMRRSKRVLGQRVFNIDAMAAKYMAKTQEPCRNGREIDYKARRLLREDAASDSSDDDSDHDGGPGGRATASSHQQSGNSSSLQKYSDTADFEPLTATPYVNSFASRLLGRAVMDDSLTTSVTTVSPFHGRFLRPYIWRDFIDVSKPETSKRRLGSRSSLAALHVHRSIKARAHPLFTKLHLHPIDLHDCEPIDYVFLQREHLPQVNALLCRTFWPGVDMSDALTYPEFSVVALYKRTVVGCAFLTPEAYLTYIAVAAGWEGAGIATFMIHHLTQTMPTKDITLHVSATNLAMLLYQRFGFKPERFAVDFYKSYLPRDSRQCPNAFFMRLRRY